MAVHEHSSGGFRAYKKIFGTEHQLYFKEKSQADEAQVELNRKSRAAHSLRGPSLFSDCGRMKGLRIRKYKKTTKVMFQLQVGINGKQVKTERMYKTSFEFMWGIFLKLWMEHFNLNARDLVGFKCEIRKANRLYMQDLYLLENPVG